LDSSPSLFALLGFARGADPLVEQAIERFRAMGMDWHADETEKLLPRA
jgi:hypothetical protein